MRKRTSQFETLKPLLSALLLVLCFVAGGGRKGACFILQKKRQREAQISFHLFNFVAVKIPVRADQYGFSEAIRLEDRFDLSPPFSFSFSLCKISFCSVFSEKPMALEESLLEVAHDASVEDGIGTRLFIKGYNSKNASY